jgi:hypothetical protein
MSNPLLAFSTFSENFVRSMPQVVHVVALRQMRPLQNGH